MKPEKEDKKKKRKKSDNEKKSLLEIKRWLGKVHYSDVQIRAVLLFSSAKLCTK